MSAKHDKEIVRGYFEGVFNKRQLERIEEFIAPDYTNHNSLSRISGLADIKRMVAAEKCRSPALDVARAN